MLSLRTILMGLALLPLAAMAGGEDDFGTWIELGAQKSINRQWHVGLEGELRTEDNSSRVDRLSVGVNTSYRVHKYLKVGVTYNFLAGYSPEKRKEKYNGTTWKGYNLTENYWVPKHRVSLEASSSVKLWKWLRIGIRERYQLTREMEVNYEKEKYRYNKVGTDYVLQAGYPQTDIDTREACTEQYLRSRLKLSVDKKHFDWRPFVSLEFHNSIDRSMHLHKLRTAVGTEYKINHHHAVSAAYVLTNHLADTPNKRMHALNVGYNFDF